MKPSQIEGGIKTGVKVGAIVVLGIVHFVLPKIKGVIVKKHFRSH